MAGQRIKKLSRTTPNSPTRATEMAVLAVAAISVFSVLPFFVAGGWFTSVEVAGQSPQAWLTIFIPLLLSVGIVVTVVTDQRKGLLPLFQKPLVLASTIVTILLFWITFQWVNLLVLSGRDIAAFQSVLVATATVLSVVLFARTRMNPVLFHQVFAGAGVLGGVLVIADSFVSALTITSPHTMQYLLIPLVSVLVLSGDRPWWLLGAAIILQAIIIPSPRMAIATAIVILILGAFLVPHLKFVWRASVIIGAATMLYLNLRLNTGLFFRFTQTGDYGIEVPLPARPKADPGSPETMWEDSSEVSAESPALSEPMISTSPEMLTESSALVINTNGRLEMWTLLIQEINATTLFLGNGAGFSRNFLGANPAWTQPHNEYLRLLVDFGLPGLVLWLTLLLAIFVIGLTSYRKFPSISFGMIGACVALGLMSLTDISMVSFAFMLPFGIVIGSSLSALHNASYDGPIKTQIGLPRGFTGRLLAG